MSLSRTKPLLAVLIDADNIPARHATAIFAEIAGLGEPALRRVYGDWSRPALGQWKEHARDLGLVMHQQSANTTGKNASDIGLVIDAMDILHAGRVQGFVLVSSDSDFTRLASRIRENGLQVIGIGEVKTPDSLRKVCNRFVLIENIVASAEADRDTKTERSGAKSVEVVRPKEPPTRAIPIVRKAMEQIDPDQREFTLSQLGSVMVQLHPDFDPRTFGYKKLSEILPKTGRFDVFTAKNNVLMVREKP